MIKDCLEDYLMLLNLHRRSVRDENQRNTGAFAPTGTPTVEEVMKFSDYYYGPPKLPKASMHGSL